MKSEEKERGEDFWVEGGEETGEGERVSTRGERQGE